MTYLEKYMQEYPQVLAQNAVHMNCPTKDTFDNCKKVYIPDICKKCWNREIPDTEEKSESDKWVCIDCHYCQDDDGYAVCTNGDVIVCCEHTVECDAYTKSQSIVCAELAKDFAEGLSDGLKDSQPTIKDSGARREFETGAVRDIQEGKGRCDLLPLDVLAQLVKYKQICDQEGVNDVFMDIELFTNTGNKNFLFNALSHCCIFVDPFTMLLEVSKHFEEGAKKYGEYNWQKGIPTHCYIDSAVRHYLKYLRGDKDEPHDRAFVWNILCCIWTCVHKPELNDYKKD